jgi:hypothetical protein
MTSSRTPAFTQASSFHKLWVPPGYIILVWCVFFKPCTKLKLHHNHRSGHLETMYTESLLLLRRHLGNWSRGPAVSIRSELTVAHILCIPWEHNVPYGANRTEHGTAFLGSLGLVKLEITAPPEGRYSDPVHTLVFNNAREC